MLRCSARLISVECRKLRFRLVDFDVSIWLVYALLRFTFPVFVSENRFAAPRRVLIFGIVSRTPVFFNYWLFYGVQLT